MKLSKMICIAALAATPLMSFAAIYDATLVEKPAGTVLRIAHTVPLADGDIVKLSYRGKPAKALITSPKKIEALGRLVIKYKGISNYKVIRIENTDRAGAMLVSAGVPAIELPAAYKDAFANEVENIGFRFTQATQATPTLLTDSAITGAQDEPVAFYLVFDADNAVEDGRGLGV